MAYERASIQRMTGYVPGKQPTTTDTVKLNTNENPYPPAPEVMRALLEVPADVLRRYPEPLADAFREIAAQVHGVAREQLIAVNGGDELLRLAVTTFVEPGTPIGVLEPSYSLYPVLAEIHGSPLVRVPAAEDFSVPPDFAARLNHEGVNLALLVNPHAPSGTLVSRTQISAIARELRGVLLVDEAYVDFADPELGHDLLPLLAEHDNLLFLRTLSKGYSLAGLRFGYGIGRAELIAPMLEKTRDSYNVDVVAQRLAAAALLARGHAVETWKSVRQERARLRETLAALGLRVLPSQSNFLLAFVPITYAAAEQSSRPTTYAAAEQSSRPTTYAAAEQSSRPTTYPAAAELRDRLEAGGLLVRHFAQDRLDDALRITVGTPEQNDRLISLLRNLLPGR